MSSLLGNILHGHPENGEIRAVYPAQAATGAGFGLYGSRGVISLIIKFRREFEHADRAERYTETAALA